MLLSNLFQPALGLLGLSKQLHTDHYVSSDMGLNSVSTLIVGSNAGVLIDPSFFLTDAAECAQWAKKKLGNKELSAVFITHHHPVFPRTQSLIAPGSELIEGSLFRGKRNL
jgi:Metallo-beta-lactamase superfamily